LLISGLFNLEDKFVFYHHHLIIPFTENNKINFLRARYLGKDGTPESYGNIGKYISLHNFSSNLTVKRFFNADMLKSTLKGEQIIICEGEFDTMIMHQSGYKALGVLGVSSFPMSLIHLLYDKVIVLALDNDEAGMKATKQIVNIFNRPLKAIKIKKCKDLTEVAAYGKS
jgi:5S rRNA maturation endonuclease (ribonuclease M5)